ncbi:IS5 family transposase domain protein [Rickettsiales endosymbiont of Paramecium tredecaurelia]|nr:IS5 family transposase domain protein [Candidatus Sarmatiella mevalonica]MBL3285154.1 IS5 family transposase domain protein [Candidatus Sarmatiella mevalonica]
MKYEQIKKLEAEKFRGLTGVKQETFCKTVVILPRSRNQKESKRWQKKQVKYPRSFTYGS